MVGTYHEASVPRSDVPEKSYHEVSGCRGEEPSTLTLLLSGIKARTRESDSQ